MAKVQDTEFRGNTAGNCGGGLHVTFGAMVRLMSCEFQGNTAQCTDDGLGGGAVYVRNGRLHMTGCSISGNTANRAGGGVLVLASRDVRAQEWRDLSGVLHPTATITSTSFTANRSQTYGGGALAALRYRAWDGGTTWYGWNELFRQNNGRKVSYVNLGGCAVSNNQNPDNSQDAYALDDKTGGVYWKDAGDDFYSAQAFQSCLAGAWNRSGLLPAGVTGAEVAAKQAPVYTYGISETDMVKDSLTNSQIGANQGYTFVVCNPHDGKVTMPGGQEVYVFPWTAANFVNEGNTIADPKILSVERP